MTTKKKAGRPRTIDAAKEREVLAIVAVGGSLNEAAEYIGVTAEALRQHRHRDDDFERRVKRATARGKVALLRKVHNAKDWRSAAWMLERKYPREYGRQDRITHGGEVDVAHSGSIATEEKVPPGFFTEDETLLLDALAYRMALQAKGPIRPGVTPPGFFSKEERAFLRTVAMRKLDASKVTPQTQQVAPARQITGPEMTRRGSV